jgi:hypothetical protein
MEVRAVQATCAGRSELREQRGSRIAFPKAIFGAGAVAEAAEGDGPIR